MTQVSSNKSKELLKGIIADMEGFQQQCGSLDDLKAEIKEAEHQLEQTKHDLKLYGLEIAEQQAILRRMERTIEEHDRKIDAQREEIRSLTAERDMISGGLQQLRARLGS